MAGYPGVVGSIAGRGQHRKWMDGWRAGEYGEKWEVTGVMEVTAKWEASPAVNLFAIELLNYNHEKIAQREKYGYFQTLFISKVRPYRFHFMKKKQFLPLRFYYLHIFIIIILSADYHISLVFKE